MIDFYADWCGPCKIMAPIFEEVSKEKIFQDKVRFLKINRDYNRDLIAKYGFTIPTIPRFFLVESTQTKFDNSNILLELGGSQNHQTMIDQITNKLNVFNIQNMSNNS
ncbi:MAG: thioredoxin family protein, partial [Dolichospermum sp.]